MFRQFRNRTDPEPSDDTNTESDLQKVTSRPLTNTTLNAAFPNHACLASLHMVLPQCSRQDLQAKGHK